MLFLRIQFILRFLYHKSVTTCQIDSYKASNSKLKPGLRKCVNIKISKYTAPPQQQHKRGTIFWDTPYKLAKASLSPAFDLFHHVTQCCGTHISRD